MHPTGGQPGAAARAESAARVRRSCGRPPSGDSPTLDPAVGILLGREQARHHDEWVTTQAQLRSAIHRSPASLVEQLETDLAATATAAITALEMVRTAAEATPEAYAELVSERAEHALAATAAALRSALTSHLAMEAQLRASPGQAG